MKNRLYLLSLLFAAIAALKVSAQITVSYPLENCVFQRDANSRSNIYVAGNFSEFLDVIEIRLTPVQPGWGQESDWIHIQSHPANGYYSGSIEWSAGWYRLDVRGKAGGSVVGTATVNKVGIGEVFLIAGQSNGQGFHGNGAQSSNDERVIHADYDGIFGPNQPFPYASFSRLHADDIISPRGKSAWFWGKLGDALANRLNMPVLFYNTAWEGSGVQAWKESINGKGWSVYVPDIPFEPDGMPYGNLRHTMLGYVAITGVRAILWVQGEADNDVGTSRNSYYSSLETVINHTRNEFRRNLSWVVSRTSYTARAGFGTQIIGAQNDIINNIPNVFPGPEMDQIQVPRYDGYHLSGDGLIQAANAWAGYLNDDFFSRSVPHQPRHPISLNFSCQNNTMVITAEGGLSNYRWNNGNSGQQIATGEGIFQVNGTDQEGNLRFSPIIRIPGNFNAASPPEVWSEGAPEVCYGGSLTLVSSSDRNPVWDTGHHGNSIQVSNPGTYSVSVENVYGCRTSSAPFHVALSGKPLPAPPAISSAGPTEICDGEEVALSSSTGSNTYWSTGANESVINIRNGGEYTARTRDSEGCFSENSNGISVHVNPLPVKPMISAEGETFFCDGGEVILRSSYKEGNTWSDNSRNETIVVKKSGEFLVSVTDGKGCRNTSDVMKVTVNPLPAAPVVSARRPLTFCEGDYTTLISDSKYSYSWNNGASDRQINVNQNGDYWLTATDENGCTSSRSNTMTVKVNPLPARPTVTVVGNTTFCENASVRLEAPDALGYLWNSGETTRNLTIGKAGSFSVQVLNEFGCHSPRSAAVVTRTLPIPAAPVITAAGPTDICDDSEVTLRARGTSPFIWNNDENTSSIKAGESGTYSARSVGSNGCFSNPSNEIEVISRITPPLPVLEKNGSFALMVSNGLSGASYNWSENNQPLTDIHTGNLRINRSGEYQAQAFFRYTDALTCYSGYSEPVFFNIPPGTDGVNIFPNPSSGANIKLETAEVLTNAVVTVYSMYGIKIASFTFDTISLPVEISLPPGLSGIYVVKVEAANFRATDKLVIQK